MAKTDLRSAYRHVPVHPSNQHLLGIEWSGQLYYDRALPFGLRSAPKLFSAVTDGLAWALNCAGVTGTVHYLDDFLLWGPADCPRCAIAMHMATEICMRLGLPTAPDKTVGLSTTITFLGIELDSVAQELRLPSIKLQHLRSSLAEWELKRNTSKHELQVLIGHLSHVVSVVRPGRVFIRHLIDTSKIPCWQTHRVHLNAKCRSNITWWLAFAQGWNGGCPCFCPCTWSNSFL